MRPVKYVKDDRIRPSWHRQVLPSYKNAIIPLLCYVIFERKRLFFVPSYFFYFCLLSFIHPPFLNQFMCLFKYMCFLVYLQPSSRGNKKCANTKRLHRNVWKNGAFYYSSSYSVEFRRECETKLFTRMKAKIGISCSISETCRRSSF